MRFAALRLQASVHSGRGKADSTEGSFRVKCRLPPFLRLALRPAVLRGQAVEGFGQIGNALRPQLALFFHAGGDDEVELHRYGLRCACRSPRRLLVQDLAGELQIIARLEELAARE